MMKGEDHLHDQYEDDEELQKLVMISNGGSKLENQNPSTTKTTTTTTGMGKLELTVDEVIEEYVGTFGLSQLIHVFLVSLAWIFDSQQSLITIFSDAQPSWACKGGGGGNWCSSGNGESVCDLVGGKWEWVGGKGSSTIAEWGLVCDYKFLASIPASLFFLGSLFGSVFYGRLADAHIGRKKTVLLSCLLTSITAFLTSFSPNIWVYSLFRFLNGFARSGIGICCLVLSTEVVGRKWRGQVGQYGFFFFTLGFLSLPIIAYPTRTNWRNMYRIISFFPFAYSIVVLPFVSESPRWLVVKGRMDEAMDILNKLAKLNGKTLPNNFTILNPSLVETNQPGSTKSLWSARWARKRIITLMMAGFGVGFVYYGIQLNVENLDFNLYYTVALNAMMEIPAVFVGSLLLTYMNRRLLLSSSAYLAGFSCILCIFLSRNKKTSEEEGRHKSRGSWGQLTAEAVGFMAASTAFDVLYIYAVELFPTNVRNFAVSLLRQALMLGASLAPLLVALGRLSPSISFLIFGGLSLLSGCLMFCLPETRNSPLYETLEHQEEEEKLSSSLDSGLELGKQ